jgi:perosamine synthetase
VKIKIGKITINEDCTIRDAMKAISYGEIGVALLAKKKDNRFIHMITDGDIRRALLSGLGLESSIKLVKKIDTIVMHIDTPPSELLRLFNGKVRIMPLINDDFQVVDLHFYDMRSHIPVAKPLFDDEEIELVNECMVTGWVSSSGKFVTEFEEMVAKHTGVKYAISCSSGTSALHLILMAYGIGKGDEVIVPSMSFIATANAVSYTGAKPVFADSDIESWNIDPTKIVNLITENTKAIIPVHLYGHPANMDPIKDIASKYNLKVIEDAAEAQGAHYKGQMTGSLADAAMFSFFGNKIITTGEGGMVVTNDAVIADKCRLLRDHGMTPKKRYWHEIIGYNYRMTNIQAAIGVAQMRKIDSIVTKKKQIATDYVEQLKNIPGIILPPNLEWADNIFWLYTILIDKAITGFSASTLILNLKNNNIDSRIVFYPMHTQPIYLTDIKLPVSEKIHKMGVSLPSSPDMNKNEVNKICQVITSLVDLYK